MTTGPSRHRHIVEFLLAAALNAIVAAPFDVSAQGVTPLANSTPPKIAEIHVVGDGIPDPIAATSGDAGRGRALVIARDPANCVLCHPISDSGIRFAGNLGPSLDGVGRRLSIAQLRLRVVDSLKIDPRTIMPSYYRVDGLERVSAAYRGKPILDAAEVEDIVAYLATLQ
jgi:L-cysteine S-thiosulfotransferase